MDQSLGKDEGEQLLAFRDCGVCGGTRGGVVVLSQLPWSYGFLSFDMLGTDAGFAARFLLGSAAALSRVGRVSLAWRRSVLVGSSSRRSSSRSV